MDQKEQSEHFRIELTSRKCGKGRAEDQLAGKSRFYLALSYPFSNYFLAFRFFLLLYLLVPTYTTFIGAPSYFSISFDNPLTTLCCLSFTGSYYRSSYTCSQPQTDYMALLSTALSVQPFLTTTFSSFSSVCRPTSPPFPFARRPTALLVLNPTSHQYKNTSI